MAVLVANIGTSDLAVKIDDYYIPVGFDRNEPNLDVSNLNEDEQLFWEQDLRQQYIIESLCAELDVEVTQNRNRAFFSFRELTEKLLNAYEANETKWHQRLSPGRIWGVIETAKTQFNAQFAYIFITDQPSKHPSDSVYLFKILQKWFQIEMNFTLQPKFIPSTIPAVDQDQLLDFYYHFFREAIPEQDVILVSIKGGTGQMQTALKMQAISSAIPNLLFIDPRLSIKNVLHGKPSESELTSYWKYMRNHKYQSVQQLLERWDFDGTSNILRDWQQVLHFLIDQNVLKRAEIRKSRKRVHLVIQALEAARSLFNLDVQAARDIVEKNPTLVEDLGLRLDKFVDPDRYDSLLNLYTQSCIYSNLVQTANLLARIGSFYEGVIHRLIKKQGGNQYLDNWRINTRLFKQDIGQDLYREFMNLEEKGYLDLTYSIKFSRFSKRNYVDIIIKHRRSNRGLTQDFSAWLEDEFSLSGGSRVKGILGLLKSLDYWIGQRNSLVHGAEGISKRRINEFDQQRPPEACTYEEILEVLATMLRSPLVALRAEDRQQFVGTDEYYIYSDVKESAIAQLMDDASQ